MISRFVSVTMLAIAAAILMPGAFATSIPFTLAPDGRIVVPLEIGGVEAPCFYLDTATRRFGLTNQMADRHWAERVFKGTINHVSAGGKMRLPLAKLHRIQFGDHRIEAGYAAIYPDRSASGPESCGMLGFDAYHGYVMRLDASNRQLELLPHPGDLARAGWRIINADYNNQGALLIDTEYRGQTLTVMLATGLSRTMLDYGAARLLFPDQFGSGAFGSAQQAHDVITTRLGYTAPEKSYDTLILPDFDVASWRLGNVEAAIAHLPVREQTGYMNANLVMLGADILATHDFALDTRAHQLWVPPTEGIQHTASQ